MEYPKKPYGLFFVIGASSGPLPETGISVSLVQMLTSVWLCCAAGGEFRGFHIRFKDVARGGIRIVMSRNREYVLTSFGCEEGPC